MCSPASACPKTRSQVALTIPTVLPTWDAPTSSVGSPITSGGYKKCQQFWSSKINSFGFPRSVSSRISSPGNWNHFPARGRTIHSVRLIIISILIPQRWGYSEFLSTAEIFPTRTCCLATNAATISVGTFHKLLGKPSGQWGFFEDNCPTSMRINCMHIWWLSVCDRYHSPSMWSSSSASYSNFESQCL